MGPRSAQDRPKTLPRRSSRASFFVFVFDIDFEASWVRFGPHLGSLLGSKIGQSAAQQRSLLTLKRPQQPKTAQDGLKRPQEAPKTPQEALPRPSKSQNDAPSGQNDPPSGQNDSPSGQIDLQKRPPEHNTTHNTEHNTTQQHRTQDNTAHLDSTRQGGGATLLGALGSLLGSLGRQIHTFARVLGVACVCARGNQGAA